MADLLECLLQIKGLRETADRIATLVRGPGAAAAWDDERASRGHELVARLADAELRHGSWLRAMLASNRPLLASVCPEPGGGRSDVRPGETLTDRHGARWADDLDRFLEQRADNLRTLDRCSAQDLSRKGVRPDGSTLIVADVVAFMLANDVEILGELRLALEAGRRDE